MHKGVSREEMRRKSQGRAALLSSSRRRSEVRVVVCHRPTGGTTVTARWGPGAVGHGYSQDGREVFIVHLLMSLDFND